MRVAPSAAAATRQAATIVGFRTHPARFAFRQPGATDNVDIEGYVFIHLRKTPVIAKPGERAAMRRFDYRESHIDAQIDVDTADASRRVPQGSPYTVLDMLQAVLFVVLVGLLFAQP